MIYTHAAAAIAALTIGLVGGWKVHAWKTGAETAERIKAEQAEALRRVRQADRAAEQFEQDRAAQRARVQVIIREVDRVVEKPVYRNLCLDADGLRLIADAIGPAADPGQPAPALPASGPAR